MSSVSLQASCEFSNDEFMVLVKYLTFVNPTTNNWIFLFYYWYYGIVP